MLKQILLIYAFGIGANCLAQNRPDVTRIKDDIYSIKIANQQLETSPEIGGRIVSLKLDGINFLTGKEINELYWGSTLWPSPQKIWGGPNLVELDHKAYAVSIESNVIKMVSQKDPKFGFVFTKEIWGSLRDSSFNIKYSITNQSDSVKKVAPWEVTRVYPNGLTFYPKGNGERWGNGANLAEDKIGITWFEYGSNVPNQHRKFFSDGAEGWSAQVNGDVIFIKKFPDIPLEKAAPSEAEVEIYTNADKTYAEIELQGIYEELKPAASLSWQVTWYIRKLPATIKREIGNPELVSFVRKLVNSYKKTN